MLNHNVVSCNKKRSLDLRSLRSPLKTYSFYFKIMPQTITIAQNPLTDRDRTIIATIVNQSDYPHDCQPQDVVTIWINEDNIVWVKMTHGFARFHKEPFKAAVAEVKANLPETPRERNERLSAELEAACTKFGLWHGEIDWLSFSTKVFQGKDLVGFVGYNLEDKWYSRRNQLGSSRITDNVDAAITALGVRQPVAA
ncbi:hypothetical protein I8751_22020 [Nostocaceae cyanobacterium CENA357]|uniref:Uncharacterized protein n=1 Tax=Atlanticothrix silvestris CENA357 TaxID=1725252 RepID=A0A8J7L3H2_9CYAN|nr:hypothetical protein [Atlanticothrix silvestris]MBH8554975.1 hypothetical protein [Atlanticothrix silvestris CENA357]